MIKVLSLDGGGMRGIIPATVLQYVESELQKRSKKPNLRLADCFDFMAGTSTGGILTCLYLLPNAPVVKGGASSAFSADDALNFYVDNGHGIFNGSRYSFYGLRRFMDATQYNPHYLEGLLDEKFQDAKISSLLKPCIVTSYNLEERKALFFSSRERCEKEVDYYVKDVARSTSAAPTYFPPAEIQNLKTGKRVHNIDGGVFANNPTMCAYTECRKLQFNGQHPTAKDMIILSLGTGGGAVELPNIAKSKRWSILSWAKSVPNIMMDGGLDTVHHEMLNLYASLPKGSAGRYVRYDYPGKGNERPYAKDMSDASKTNIDALKEAGKHTLEHALNNDLDALIDLLLK